VLTGSRVHPLRPRALIAQIAIYVVIALVAGGCFFFDVPSEVHTISVGGMQRTYRLYTPPNLPPNAPLVVVMHGALANTINAETTSGFDQRARIGKFLVAYPDGIDKTWNAYGCCGDATKKNIDDVAFITAVVNDIPGINRQRVYATGLSNGAMMAYTMACRTDLFAAIGVVAATMFDPCPDPRPTSVMHIQGLADNLVKFNGTPKGDTATVDGPPIPDVNAFWRRVDDCAPPEVSKNETVTITAAKCPDNREVVLVTVDDLGHEWPDNAAAAFWKFFERHPK
jgi:polyhydroxybutyrate depolymerase